MNSLDLLPWVFGAIATGFVGYAGLLAFQSRRAERRDASAATRTPAE